MDDELDHLQDACGVVACFAVPPKKAPAAASTAPDAAGGAGAAAAAASPDSNVAAVIATALIGLQHRGQESCGLVTANQGDSELAIWKGMGQASVVMDKNVLRMEGHMGIGHTRYSTHGESSAINSQPFVVRTLHGSLALAHNGQLTNADKLRRLVQQHGVGMTTSVDSEIIAQPHSEHIHGFDFVARMSAFMKMCLGAYSLTVLTKDAAYAIRDPYGNRPLSLGVIGEGTDTPQYVAASESCVFGSIDATLVREVLPGEIVRLDENGFTSLAIVKPPPSKPAAPALCIFEYVYFARPDTVLEGQMVHAVRQRCGATLAKEHPVDADLVSTVPDSATPAAIGYARAMGLPYDEVLSKNRYVGRTFIQPSQDARKLRVKQKFGVLTHAIKGKRIILVDDSIVRGTTMAPIVKLLRENGAKEVHIRVASPPIKHPCFMGINIPTREELVANLVPLEEIGKHFNADSLEYLSVDGLVQTVQEGVKEGLPKGHCTACLTGKYPIELEW